MERNNQITVHDDQQEFDALQRFVVRYAPDVMSQPMTIDQLAYALVEGKLLPEMLFSEVGTTCWQPLTFVAPIQQSQPEIDIELVKGYYVPSGLLVLFGILLSIVGVLLGNEPGGLSVRSSRPDLGKRPLGCQQNHCYSSKNQTLQRA